MPCRYVSFKEFSEGLKWHDLEKKEMLPSESFSSALHNIHTKHKKAIAKYSRKGMEGMEPPEVQDDHHWEHQIAKHVAGKARLPSMIRYIEHKNGTSLSISQRQIQKVRKNREDARIRGKVLHGIQLKSPGPAKSNEKVPLHALAKLFELEGIEITDDIVQRCLVAFKKVVPTSTQMDMNQFDIVMAAIGIKNKATLDAAGNHDHPLSLTLTLTWQP